MAVPAGPTEKRYTGNGVTTIFTIPFLLIAASDLDVFVNGVEVVSGFTITGAGNPTSTITFSVAPANLSSILLTLNVPFERLNDYQENGDFLSSTVNRDFDRIWQALKQLLGYSRRALTLGPTDVDGAGAYRAKGNRISDLADPVSQQDAATKNWVGLLLDGVSGVVNTTVGIAYDAGTLFDYLRFGVQRTVDTYAAMIALSPSRNMRCKILGYYQIGDEGGGDYFYNGAAWQLIHNGTVSVLQYGAKLDGVTNSSAAFNTALADPLVSKVIAPYGELGYSITSLVTLARMRTELVGESYVKIKQGAANSIFKIQASFQSIKGFTIMGAAGTVEPILIGTDVIGLTTISVTDMYGVACKGFIKDGNHATNLAVFVNFERITVEQHRGYGIRTFDCWASYYVRNVVVDRVGMSGAEYNFPGFEIQNAQGVFFLDNAMNGSSASGVQSLQDGCLFVNCGFVVIDNFIPDHPGGYGMNAENTANIKIKKCSTPNASSGAIRLLVCNDITISDINGSCYAGGPAGSNGVLLSGCTIVKADSIDMKGFKNDGWLSDSCSRIQLTASTFTSNANRGIVNTAGAGGTSAVLISHCITAANTSGNVYVEGTSSYVRDCISNAGTLLNGVGPYTA